MPRAWLFASLAVLLLASSAAASLGEYARTVLNLEPNRHLAQLALISDQEGSLARTFFSPAHKRAASQLKSWMEEAGMESWVDAVGNVHGRLNGSNPTAPAIVIGSHYDTVLDGGNYDGALGIIVGIAAAKALLVQAAQTQGLLLPSPEEMANNVALPVSTVDQAALALRRPLHVVGFTDEEGVRFQSTFLGSRAMAGTLISYDMLQSRDKQGQSLAEVLQQELGSEVDVEQVVQGLALPAGSIAQYLEVHMEQGPVLEARALRLGVVSAIAGQTRLWLVINGTQGHAGTVPMAGRRDALAAAAHVVVTVEGRCGGGHTRDPQAVQALESDMLVCTVGELHVWPGASNVIPGSVHLSIDIRAKSDALRTGVVESLSEAIRALCVVRGVTCELTRKHDAGAVLVEAAAMEGLRRAILRSTASLPEVLGPCASTDEAAGEAAESCDWVEGAEAEVPVMVSGAGHDALAMAEVTQMAMMFVRCRGGVSHSPLEYVHPADVAAAAAALTEYLKEQLL